MRVWWDVGDIESNFGDTVMLDFNNFIELDRVGENFKYLDFVVERYALSRSVSSGCKGICTFWSPVCHPHSNDGAILKSKQLFLLLAVIPLIDA